MSITTTSFNFWQGKRVLLTGHTGFKGAWMTLLLQQLGAEVFGFSLLPDSDPNLLDQLDIKTDLKHEIGDIRDPVALKIRMENVRPDVIFHFAAQPLVLRGYAEPQETWNINVMGTVNLLEAVRNSGQQISVVCITTDKVYANREWVHGYRETDRLGGHDPYSSSKAACELAIDSYRKSFFGSGERVRIASARAGNVIGGGDWAENRIIPDLVRANISSTSLDVRAPSAIRPWQHVLDPLSGYLILAEALAVNQPGLQDAFNFGPDANSQRPVRDVVETAFTHWPGSWHDTSDSDTPHEAGRLALSTDKAQALLSWTPQWDFETTLAKTMNWYRSVHEGHDPHKITQEQITSFLASAS